MSKEIIDLILGMLNASIKIAELADPKLDNNPVIVEIQKAVAAIQELGL